MRARHHSDGFGCWGRLPVRGERVPLLPRARPGLVGSAACGTACGTYPQLVVQRVWQRGVPALAEGVPAAHPALLSRRLGRLQPADGGWERGQGVAEAAEAAEGQQLAGASGCAGRHPAPACPPCQAHARFPLQARPPPKTAPGSQASGRRRSARQRLAWRKPSGTYSRPSGSRSPVNSISTCPEERVGRGCTRGEGRGQGRGSTALQAGSTPADSSRGVEVARRPGWQTARLVSPRRSRLAGWLAGWMAATPAHLPLAKHPPRKVGLLGRPRWHDAWLSYVSPKVEMRAARLSGRSAGGAAPASGDGEKAAAALAAGGAAAAEAAARPSSGGSTVTTCLRRRAMGG